MPEIIRDNRSILKYRGLASPSIETIRDQTAARRAAIIRLSQLAQTRSSEYLIDNMPNNLAKTAFMRLLPVTQNDTIYDFYFPFTPQSIQYSDLSDEVAEIARPGSTPILVFKSHRLMRVSMEFVVAVPYDGLITDVEESLKLLRTFATSSNRSVVFFNLDSMLLSGWKYRNGPSNRPPVFSIADLSIEARQRNSEGKITQASVSLTVVENQNPQIVTARISPFTPLPRPPTTKTPGRTPTPKRNKYIEFTLNAPNRVQPPG